MQLIKCTPSIGAKLLEPAKIFHRVANAIEAYHENWMELDIQRIEVTTFHESRIIGSCRAYTAMTALALIAKTLTRKMHLKILEEGSGKTGIHYW